VSIESEGRSAFNRGLEMAKSTEAAKVINKPTLHGRMVKSAIKMRHIKEQHRIGFLTSIAQASEALEAMAQNKPLKPPGKS
jgi:hypothetical protein